MLCIGLLDKDNEGIVSDILTLKLWGKIHINNVDVMWRNVDVLWNIVEECGCSVDVMWEDCGGMWMLCGK